MKLPACTLKICRRIIVASHVNRRYFHKLPPEIAQIQNFSRRYAKDKLQPIAGALDRYNAFPSEQINEIGALGLLAVGVAQEDGGAGLGTLALAVAVEELSAGCASTGAIVSIHNCLYANLLANYANETQKDDFLKPFTTGTLGCFALSEADAGSDVAALQTTAVHCNGNFLLNGTKSWVTSGTVGEAAVIFATIDKSLKYKGITGFLVPLSSPGITKGNPEDKLGIRAAPCCSITLENVQVPAENVLGEIGDGFKMAMMQLEQARIGIAAQALGISQAALDCAVAYSFHRTAFKQPINEFQAVKLRIADMALQLESARLLVRRAATLYDENDEKCRVSKECSMAKTAASQAANSITHNAIQILGGMGYVKNMPVERHFRDARVTEIYGGVTDIQKFIIADCILEEYRQQNVR